MGDWDYGRENGLWGDDGIPFSIYRKDEDDYDLDEDELDNKYKTIEEWNNLNKRVKKGAIGLKVKGLNKHVFNEKDTYLIEKKN